MALTQTQVSQLYVAIFGRASEGSGNAYWQAEASLSSAATDMLATTAAATYFGSSLSTNQAFIEHIYLNTLGKTYAQDKAGIDYWVEALKTNSKGSVVSDLIAAAQSTTNASAAQDQFNNRVKVSNSMADLVFDTPADYATSTAFKAGGLVVTNDQTTVTTATKVIIDKTTHINFTTQMANNLTLFMFDSDLSDSNFTKGIDALHKLTFNIDGTTTETSFTAPFGSSSWTKNETGSSTWSIADGKLVVNGNDGNYTWNDTLTLMSQTATEMKFYDQISETDTMGTSSALDDATSKESEFVTFKLAEPSPRTEAQILSQTALDKIDFDGQIHFTNASVVPSDVKLTLHLIGTEVYIQHVDIGNNGWFEGVAYVENGDAYASSTAVDFGYYHDVNGNGSWETNENGFSIHTTLAGIGSTTMTLY